MIIFLNQRRKLVFLTTKSWIVLIFRSVAAQIIPDFYFDRQKIFPISQSTFFCASSEQIKSIVQIWTWNWMLLGTLITSTTSPALQIGKHYIHTSWNFQHFKFWQNLLRFFSYSSLAIYVWRTVDTAFQWKIYCFFRLSMAAWHNFF